MAEQFGVPVAGANLDGNQSNDDGDNLIELAFRLFMTYVRPYLWLYLVTVILFLAAGYVFLKTATPIYESTAQMLISSGETRAINVDGMDDPTSDIKGDIFLRTQMMVMQSDEILNQVYERMGMLGENSLLVEGPKIEREIGTSLVNIKARSENREAAAKFANTVAEVYMDFMFKRRSSLSSTGVDLLRDQLREVQASSQKAMDEFLKFKEEHGIFDLKQTYDTLNRQKLDLTNKIFEAELDADEIKMSLEEIEANRKIAVIMLPYLIPQNSSAMLSNIQQMILNHQMDLPRLMTQYSEAHQVIQVHGKVGELLDKAAEDQVDISVNGLKLKYQRTLKLKEKLTQQIKEIEQRLVELDRLSGDYRIRENAVNKLDETISNITGRINDIQIAEATTIGNFAISRVNDAKVAINPAFPRPKIILALSFLLGIAVAGGTAFILVFLNDKVTEREELAAAFSNQVATFGSVPHFDEDEKTLLKSTGDDHVDEAFRDIRTSLNLSMVTRDRKILAITSAIPGEGKTFVICNLARSFARDNKRVLLLDFDMRKPRLNKLLEQYIPADAMKRGLSNVLVGDCKLEDVIIHLDDFNMDVAFCGPIPPNPNELLGGERFGNLLEEVRQKYDLTLLDIPPCLAVSDTLVIASHDVALLVVSRLFKLSKPILGELVERFRQVSIQPVGLIANNADVPTNHYGKYGYGKYGYRYGKYGYRYGKYGYGYGYGYGKKKKQASS